MGDNSLRSVGCTKVNGVDRPRSTDQETGQARDSWMAYLKSGIWHT